MRCSGKRNRLSIAALAAYCLSLSGCASLNLPRIDPTGERVFAQPPVAIAPEYFGQPAAIAPQYLAQPGPSPFVEDIEVILSPQATVAPIGAEVALVAGVRGSDGYLRTNRRLEWSLAPGGPGYVVAVGKNGPIDLLLGDFNHPRKVDNTFAIGSTSRSYLRLSRGTPTTEDDVCVLRGQGWITLSSPVEGTSRVSVLAPEVRGWDCRTRAATVHWVDAQWCFPPPAINPAGTSHVFTTTVLRHSNESPRAGWLVRYEIIDGPPAGFAPDGSPVIELPTDAAGQASVEIFQKEPGPGTNRVRIQIVRPAAAGDAYGQRLVVATGSTLKTWTSPKLTVRINGPAAASVGTTLSYAIQVCNPGDMPAEDVVVSDQLPYALAYLSSNPAAQLDGQTVRWQLGRLGPGETQTLGLDARATQAGNVTNCAEAIAAAGLKSSHCATAAVAAVAAVAAPSIDVSMTGPTQATVGSQVTFEILIANNGRTPATGLLIRDSFDPGLEHALAETQEAATRRIERDLGQLAPGQSERLTVTFYVTRAGRLCHSVEVTGENAVRATAEACLTAAAEAALPLQPPSQQRPSIAVHKSILDEYNLPIEDDTELPIRHVGDTVRFAVDVINNGPMELTNLTLVDRYDTSLELTAASEEYRLENGALVCTIDSLPSGTPLRFEAECRCLSAVALACNRAILTAEEGTQTADEACLQVHSAAAGLPITVHDLDDPVAVNKGVTYVISVSNPTESPHRDVAVVATVPVGMIADRIGTNGPQGYTIEHQVIRFEPVPELLPGKRLDYRVRVQTRQAGKFSFRAEVTSRELPEPTSATETTEAVE